MSPRSLILVSFIAVAIAALGAGAQTRSAPPFRGPVLARDRVLAPAIETLQVSSPVIPASGVIPLLYSAYGKGVSPPLSWSAGPFGTKAYVVIMEDPDSHQPQPTLHWLAYNIPGDLTSIGKAMHDRAVLPGEHGFLQGKNSKGGIGYIGPHPPVGDPAHHYHIQVFALRRMLPLGGGASLEQVVEAMNDRVLAEGELVASFEAPKPEAPPATGQKPDARAQR